MNFTPLALHILIALAGTIAAIRARSQRRPRLLPAYLAFVALAGITGGIVLHFTPSWYRAFFWLAEFAHNALLTALALEIISDVLPRKLAAPWAVFFGSSLILSIMRQWPTTSTPALLNVSISAMATAGLLLIALAFVRGIEWRSSYALAAIGLAAVLAGSLIPAMKWITGAVSPLALQIGDVPGLVILAWACWAGRDLELQHEHETSKTHAAGR
jgi:hypothetical protein